MRDRAPLAVALAVATVWVAALVYAIYETTGGVWAYPLDDTYIHLSLARTLVESGTWGLNPGEYAAATSSPGWALLLTLPMALGLDSWVAAAFAAVAGAVLLL